MSRQRRDLPHPCSVRMLRTGRHPRNVRMLRTYQHQHPISHNATRDVLNDEQHTMGLNKEASR